MRVFSWTDLDSDGRAAALARPALLSDDTLIENVRTIMETVKQGGDSAVLDYTERFDGVRPNSLCIPIESLKTAWDSLDPADQAAMQLAKANIEAFHRAQLPQAIALEVMPGVSCRREPRALDSAGLYVPGGTAPLVSTLMMLAIPAKIAGVGRAIVTTPPGKDGKIHPAILGAAYICGIEEVFAVGGAQAIAAMAYGTESIPKGTKIFGPGNAYVAMAKSIAAQEPGGPAIDLPAGPSEAMVLADDAANTAFVASDLLSQAEHDTVAQVVCVCRSHSFAKRLQAEIEAQVSILPREDIARKALKNGRLIVADSQDDMINAVNLYAPEHLIVQIENAESIVPDIQNAGSIFLGPWTPESVGDYASGTNHTLPTNGAARAYSGVTTESFMKYISVQSLTGDGLKAIGPAVERLADLEGLQAHKNAVTLRLSALKDAT